MLTVSVIDGPSSGTTEVNEDGTITYTPDANFAGTDSFTYEVNDGNGGTDTAIVTITIGGENDEPVALDDAADAAEGDGPALIDVLDNDSDVDEDTLTVTDVDDLGTIGAVTLADGDVSYSPNGQFESLADGEEATDTFEYSISDGNGGTDSATVTVTIAGENDDPVAADDDEESTDEDTAFDVDVLGNDTDAEDDELAVSTIDTTGTVGTVTLVDGTVNYDPAGAFEGLGDGDSAADAFSYTVSDGNGGTDTAAVTVTVNGVNDDPVAADDDEESTDEDTAFDVDVLGNDTDAEDDELAVSTIDTTGTVGTVTLVDGTVNYDPAGAFEGLGDGDSATDTFSYTVSDGNGGTDTATVTVTVNGVNDDPVADDDAVDVTEDDAASTVDVLDNDNDAEGDDLSVTAVDVIGTVGSVTLIDGVVSYDPAGGFESLAAGEDTTDSFGYSISDGNGGSDSATVTVTVNGVNDDPVAADDAEESTDEDTPLDVDVLANDFDVDESDDLTVTVTVDATNGTTEVNEDGSVTYTPAADYFGEDSFTYQVDDGNGGTDTAVVTVTVNPINDDPVADDDTAATDEDTATDIDVLDNDTDVDEDTLLVTIAVDPSDGAVEVNEDGTIAYTPDENFFGEDSFTYQVDDGNGGTDTAVVTVTVNAVNDDPTAGDDSGAGFELDAGVPSFVTADVLANDSDIDGGALSVTILDLTGTQGTVTYLGSGTFLYENTAGLEAGAEDSWSYTVSDGNGGTDVATVTISIIAAD